MAIRITCPSCDASNTVDDDKRGRKVPCRKCDEMIRVPAEDGAKKKRAADEAIQDGKKANAKAVGARKHADDEDVDDDFSARKTKAAPAKSGSGLLLLLVLGGAALCLFPLAGVAVVVGFFLMSGKPADRPLANAQIDAPAAAKIMKDENPVIKEPVVKGPEVKELPAKKPKQDPKKPVKGPDPDPDPAPVVPPVDLDQDILKKTTQATAFIRVDYAGKTGSGSGFLVKANGDTAYLITNYHVIAVDQAEPEPKAKGKGPKGPPGFPGFPKGPPGFPRAPNPFGKGPQPKARPKVTVVLNIGTPQEQSIPAEVVAEDPEGDLAALRITGARNLPAPIDVGQEAAAAERDPVYIFGFPVKKFKQGQPSLTVAKGTITTLRRDPASNELVDVHIDGEINPGNSGGPVIDAKGRLVGIAVATVPGKLIGFAIPARDLNAMFKGRLFLGLVYQLKQQGPRLDLTGEAWEHDRKSNVVARDAITLRLPDEPKGLNLPADEYLVFTRLTDPMLKISAANMYFAQTEDVPAKPDAQGWARLANSTQVALKIQDQNARGEFKMPKGAFPDQTFAFQFSYVNADGQTIFTQPHLARLTFPKNPKSVTLNVTAIPDLPTRRYIEDSAPKWFAGKVNVKAKTNDSLVMEIDPVDDPKTIPPQIKFGEVTNVQGRTFFVTAKKIELPPPDLIEVDAALADLKLPDTGRRVGAANQLAKAYTPLPERRAEVAKALTGQAADIHVGPAAMRALLVWAGPESFDGVVIGLSNGFARNEAMEVMRVKFKGPAGAEAVAKLLPDGGARGGASATLRAMGPAAEKAVVAFITHKDLFTAKEACSILGEIGTAECIPALTAVANGNIAFVSQVARDNLKLVAARANAKGNP